MIVHCPRCQVRFRVSDEKIGPRGAKVRCSRCKDVFVVRREAEAAPPAPKIDLVELTPGLVRPVPRFDPFAAAGASAFSAGAAPEASAPAADPFAAAGLEGFVAPAPPAAAEADPFGPAPASAAPPPEPGPADPFAAGQDPFAAAAPFSSSTSLPVTDLAQLTGEVPPPPEPSPAAPPPAAPEPSFADAGAAPAFADLALEERGTPGPGPFADPADVVAASLGGPDGAAFEAGSVAQVPVGEESLALATGPIWSPPEASAPAEEAGPAAGPPPPAPTARAAGRDAQAKGTGSAAEPATPAAPLPSMGARLRAAAFDALALVVLLAVALAFRVVWRGEASLGPAAFRPSTLLRGLSAPPAPGPFQVEGVRSSLYEQAGGGAVLLVRGEVVSHAAAPADAVHVVAELVREGEVLAQGEALAGGVPTAEEVHGAVDRASLEQLAAELKTRAPRGVSPGDRLGFLVVLPDAPADVSGASVRVRADAGGAEAGGAEGKR
jgi:predicted Zn finger-like uncharacterized protein